MGTRVDFAFSLREQASLNARMCRLLYGPVGQPAMIVLSAAIPGAAILAASFIAMFFAPVDLYLLVFTLVGLPLAVLAIFIVRRLNLAWGRRATKARTLEDAACSLEARPDHLVWSGPDWRTEVAWSAVDLVDDGPQAVMVVSRGVGYFAPRRAFPDDAARRAFIAECAARLTPEARARSRLAA